MCRDGSFTDRIALASASMATGLSKLARHAIATLRDGTGEENATTFSILDA
jgi:hypothetical protein